MSTTPAPRHPMLANLFQLFVKWGPTLLNWLISAGVIKLPGGGTLPPLPTLPAGSVVTASVKDHAALDIPVEVDAKALHAALADLHAKAADLH